MATTPSAKWRNDHTERSNFSPASALVPCTSGKEKRISKNTTSMMTTINEKNGSISWSMRISLIDKPPKTTPVTK